MRPLVPLMLLFAGCATSAPPPASYALPAPPVAQRELARSTAGVRRAAECNPLLADMRDDTEFKLLGWARQQRLTPPQIEDALAEAPRIAAHLTCEQARDLFADAFARSIGQPRRPQPWDAAADQAGRLFTRADLLRACDAITAAEHGTVIARGERIATAGQVPAREIALSRQAARDTAADRASFPCATVRRLAANLRTEIGLPPASPPPAPTPPPQPIPRRPAGKLLEI